MRSIEVTCVAASLRPSGAWIVPAASNPAASNPADGGPVADRIAAARKLRGRGGPRCLEERCP